MFLLKNRGKSVLKNPHSTIGNLPKKKKPNPVVLRHIFLSTENLCGVCKIRYASSEDQRKRKTEKWKAEWLGCNIKDCNYWVHNSCLGLEGFRKDEIQNLNIDDQDLSFLCLEHKNVTQ